MTVDTTMRFGGQQSEGERLFRERLDRIVRPDVIELGTRQSIPGRSTHHKAWAPGGRWLLADAYPGSDVEKILDAHDLGDLGPFDAYIAIALYEHLRRPWIAAAAAADVLRPGGLVYVCTHQTFPLHGYPEDFFRFSDVALKTMFEDAGFEVAYVGYAYPCVIVPPTTVTVDWNHGAESYLNVELVAQL